MSWAHVLMLAGLLGGIACIVYGTRDRTVRLPPPSPCCARNGVEAIP